MTGGSVIPAGVADTVPALPPAPYGQRALHAVFGARAETAVPPGIAESAQAYPSAAFGAYALALFAAYCITILSDKTVRRRRRGAKTDGETESPKPLGAVLNARTAFTGFLAAGVAAVKAVELYAQPLPASPAAWIYAAGPAVTALAVFTLMAAEAYILKIIGRICYCTGFTDRLILLKADTFRRAVLLTTPLLLLSVLAPESTGNLLWYCYLVSAGVYLSVFLVRSLRLYAQEKISILLWFLYLCTLEIIPVWTVVKTVSGII